MSMLAFMPWCRVDKIYEVGGIQILPFERHASIDGLDAASQCYIKTILATYKTIEGKPVDRAAITRFVDKSVLADLSEEERAAFQETMVLACFSGLSHREYFNPVGRYANRDCFSFYFQK